MVTNGIFCILLFITDRDEQTETVELGVGLIFPKSSIWRKPETNAACVG